MAVEEQNEFDLARKKASAAASQAASQRKEALKRRFASLGAGPGSGARIKAEQQVDRDVAGELQRANESIDTGERLENRRRREVQDQRDFVRSEREASQGFAAGQAQLGREFARGEREASQLFRSGEGDKQRLFLTGEREAGQDFAAGQAKIGRDFAAEQAQLGRDFSAEQADIARRFAKSERLDNQAFQTAERQMSQTFASEQAEVDRLFRAGESAKARRQQRNLFEKQFAWEQEKFAVAIGQWEQQFGLDKEVTERNLELQEKLANEKGFFDELIDNATSGGGLAFGGLPKMIADRANVSIPYLNS